MSKVMRMVVKAQAWKIDEKSVFLLKFHSKGVLTKNGSNNVGRKSEEVKKR